MKLAFLALGVALFAWNALATISLLRSEQHEIHQKILQGALIWLVPVIGVSLVWFLLREHHAERLPSNLADDLPGEGTYHNDSAADGFGSGEGGADGGSH